MKKYTINGRPIRLIGTRELCKYARLSSRTIFRWEKKGILPEVIIDKKRMTGIGMHKQRLYTKEQAELILKWLDDYNLGVQGKKVQPYQLQDLHQQWEALAKQFNKQYR